MDKRTLSALIIISSVIVSGVVIGSAMAQEEEVSANIQYPIPELGNCQSQEDCKVYCDNSENTDACLAFAEAHNLMSAEEVAAAKKFQDIGMIGPGGCKGGDACEEYCNDASHLEECTTFAQENGLMSDEQLENSEKVLTAIKNGVKPPACNGEQECDKYCASAEHMEECINFGIEAGILSAHEEDNARKVLTAIKKGAEPPCYGKECEVYCGNNSVHMEECGNFAEAAGILSPAEIRRTQKLLTAMQEGINLPACTGEKECQDYCSQDVHIEECVNLAVATGDMSEEDAQIAIKTRGKGPGDCQNKEECDAFCNNPDNSEVCFNFAKDNGLISEEDQKKIEDSQQKMQESFNDMPAEVLTCLTSSLGVDTVEKMKSGNVMPSQKLGEQIKTCFKQYTPQGQPEQNQGGGGDGQGPGQSGQPGQPTQPNQPEQPGQEPSPPSPPTKPEKPADAVNPTKCIEDCEYVGRTCVGQAGDEGKVCASEGQYCRTVYCETYGVQGDNRPTQEQYHACNDNVCTPTEKRCNDAVVAKSSACITTKDVCVMNCQKAAKSGKPQQPQQPGQQPTQPTKPSQPSPPSQPSQPSQPGQQPSPPSPPSQPSPPSPPNQPSPPSPPSQPSQPGQQPSQPNPPSPPSPPE